MATFQEIRDYLEKNFDQLAQKLNPGDQTEFSTVFKNLRHDWYKSHVAEDVLLKSTLQEINKYRPVWNELIAAHLVSDEQPATSALTSARNRSGAPAVSPTPSRRTDHDQDNTKPSQPVIDRLAIWDKQIATWKEILTGVLGILIVLATLITVIFTIASVNNQTAFSAAKDVLLFMNGLVGVVLGYYFGRVPADVRADKAESETRTANRSREQVLSTVRAVLNEAGQSSDRSFNQGGINLTPAQVDSLRDVLRQYS